VILKRYVAGITVAVTLCVSCMAGNALSTNRAAASSGPLNQFAAACTSQANFFTFKPWYQFIPNCSPTGGPEITSLTDIWLILFAVVDDAVLVGGYVAVGFIIWGGFSYITSQGNAGATAKALNTIISAIVGLAIAIFSVVGVQYVAGVFGAGGGTQTGPNTNTNTGSQTIRSNGTLNIPQQ